MIAKPLSQDISVTTQIAPEALVSATVAGFRAIINNRPDGEEPGQPTSAELAGAAKAAGIDYRHIPVVPGQYGDEAIVEFRHALAECEKPVLAFCKSGLRATSLWALAQAGKQSTVEILRQAGACGFDLSPLVPQIEARAKAGPA